MGKAENEEVNRIQAAMLREMIRRKRLEKTEMQAKIVEAIRLIKSARAK